MFEHITYEKLLEQLLERVKGDLDKREGSIIYDALAPAAIELQQMYFALDGYLNEVFSDTASREYLVRRAIERNSKPHEAQSAVWKGMIAPVNLSVKIGSRFGVGTQSFQLIRKMETGECEFICEQKGIVGNSVKGNLTPYEYTPGLISCKLTELLIPGSDQEETEAFRERYLTTLRKPSTSGNKYDYFNWAMECKGVGAVKVFPLANGPGTVKIIVADENKKAASKALVDLVKEQIEEKRPIGATVSVDSVRELPINVGAKVRITKGLNLGVIQDKFTYALSEFLTETAFSISYVALARVGNILLQTVGVEDYTELILNGQPDNISLNDEELAVIGNITLEVIV